MQLSPEVFFCFLYRCCCFFLLVQWSEASQLLLVERKHISEKSLSLSPLIDKLFVAWNNLLFKRVLVCLWWHCGEFFSPGLGNDFCPKEFWYVDRSILASVVERSDSAIQRVNHYPLDRWVLSKPIEFSSE